MDYSSALPARSSKVLAPLLLKYLGVGAHPPLPAPHLPPPLWAEACSEIHRSTQGLPKLADSHALGEEVPFLFIPFVTFVLLCLSFVTTNGFKELHIVSWLFHNQLTSIDRTSVSSQFNLSLTIHSLQELSLRLKHSPISFSSIKLFLPICIYHCTDHFSTSFLFSSHKQLL